MGRHCKPAIGLYYKNVLSPVCTAGRNSPLQPWHFLPSFPSSAILNYQAGYRCTLVPRLPFPVPGSPFPVPRSPFPVPRSPFPVPRSPFPVPGISNIPDIAMNFSNKENVKLEKIAIKPFSAKSRSVVADVVRSPNMFGCIYSLACMK